MTVLSEKRQSTTRPADPNTVRAITDEQCRKSIVPVLLASLKDGERLIREAAAIALGTCGNRDDLRALIPLLEDPDRAVAEAAVMALGLSAKSMRPRLSERSLRIRARENGSGGLLHYYYYRRAA